MITVKFSGLLRKVAGCAETLLALPESRRLDDLLDAMAAVYPGILGTSADYQWRHGSSHVMIAVNGKIVEEENREVKLSEGDEVSLVPPLGGG